MVDTKKSCEYKLDTKERRLKVNCEKCIYSPDLATNPICMARTINKLMETGEVNEIVFYQKENYIYDYAQTRMLLQIANLINELVHRRNILSDSAIGAGKGCERCYPSRYDLLRMLVMYELREDPIGAYLHAVEQIGKEEKKAKTPLFEQCPECYQTFINTLTYIKDSLEKTDLIKAATPYLKDYDPKTRNVYKKILKPVIKPSFLYVKVVTDYPAGAEEIETYTLSDKSSVVILKTPDEIRPIYHLTPPEFKLTENKYDLVGKSREVIAEHKPQKSEFVDPERTREIFLSVAKDLLEDMSKAGNLEISYEELEELAKILVRHTIGFGIIEVLLSDEKIQDITINSPAGVNPITIIHEQFGECLTNVTISPREMESMATKLRMISGRPLDEANPVLDTQLIVPGGTARVCAIQQPLSPSGLAYAFRRHRSRPWTAPLFIDNKMISPLAAGLLSFIIDGARTLLIAGTRSAGKCVTGDTLIQLANGDIKQIRELEHGARQQISDGYIFHPNPPITVLSLNSNKIKSRDVDVLWRRTAPKSLVKITTQSGKEIITTPEHPYPVFDKGMQWMRADRLKKNFLLATPRRITVEANNPEIFIADANKDKDYYFLSGKTNATKIRFPCKLTKELVELIGYISGDGHIDEHKIEFTNSNKKLRIRFANYATGLFGVNTREIKDKNTFNIQITSRLLNRTIRDSFEIPFGNKASRIKIPSLILQSENRILASFLRAYFDCEAHVKKGRREVELATASKIMAKQLQFALLRFGIVSFCKPKKIKGKLYWRIFIRSRFLNRYFEYIGFNHYYKASKLQEILEKHTLDNTNIDIVPNGNQILIQLRKKLRVKPYQLRSATGKDYWAYENFEYRVSRNWFKKIISFYQKRYEELIGLEATVKELEKSFDYNLFCKLRAYLNIKNDELCGPVCLQTISNFFNKRYKPKEKTKKLLAKKIVEIYRQAIDIKVEDLIKTASELASSDIFWDRIFKIEFVEPKEKWVYDFTVEPDQNFIANGVFAHNTSLLSSMLVEIMRANRILTVEDTLELPVPQLKSLGYDVQSMKVQSVITGGKAEVPAAEGIRTSLRMGDSCLIVGEVRGPETLALYEAMRVGALANVVAGTIHGDSPYGVFDRIVNDLGVPKTSFKATDIIVICNPIKSASGLEKVRRVTSITEVRKQWTEDPLAEHAFVDLMVYNPKTDSLEPTDALIQGESEIIKAIAGRVKEWAGDWDAVWANINLRMKIKQAIVDAGKKNPSLMEADFVIRANDEFHKITELIRKETGKSDPERIFDEWEDWFKKSVKKA